MKHGMCYRQINGSNSSIKMKENLNKIIEILSLLVKLLSRIICYIFVKFKYWSIFTNSFLINVKNINVHFQKVIDKFAMRVMIAFSKDDIKTVTISKATFTSEYLKWFLLKLIKNKEDDTFIFMDNASFIRLPQL